MNRIKAKQYFIEDKANGVSYGPSLMMLTTLFFMWGFMTSLNDILIPHLREAFSLSYTEAMLVQFCFFGAYFIVSIPAGKLLDKLGYQKGIVTGLLIAGVGCLAFYPAASMLSYKVFLGALFILAAGITILQVSANPYVSALGNPRTASSRLTITQAFNSLGTTLAPYIGGIFILGLVVSESNTQDATAKIAEAQSVQIPYLVLGAMFFVMAIVFSKISLPKLPKELQGDSADSTKKSAWAYPHLTLGAVAIFVYVGAEVAIGSFLISFLGEENIAGLSVADAAPYVAYFWGGAMIGRFIGAGIMQKIDAGKVLGFNGLCAAILLLLAIISDGKLAMWAIIAIGLFNSIMFPTIFSLAVGGLKQYTSQGSGILCLAIVGGAIIPVIQGMLADAWAIQISFLLPLMCYAYIIYYGVKGCRK